MKRNRVTKNDEKKLSEWLACRTSHTLRGFSETKGTSCGNRFVKYVVSSDLLPIEKVQHVRQGFLDLVSVRQIDNKSLSNRLKSLNDADFPEFVSVAQSIFVRFSIIETEIDTEPFNALLEVFMPCNVIDEFNCPRKSCGKESGKESGKEGCCLQWMLWPETVAKPDENEEFKNIGGYHDIKIMGKHLTQPRKTVCVGKPYKFSGVEHPVTEDPSGTIQKLIDTTNNLFHLPENAQTNMCLTNWYPR